MKKKKKKKKGKKEWGGGEEGEGEEEEEEEASMTYGVDFTWNYKWKYLDWAHYTITYRYTLSVDIPFS
jgi:hypothetical protein